MKKLYLILFILPALACFSGNKIQAQITPAAAAGTAITSPAAKAIPSPTGTQAAACIVNVKSLNVRSLPESDVIAWLYSGDLVTILEDAPRDQWIHIQSGSVNGWIHSKYCTRKN